MPWTAWAAAVTPTGDVGGPPSLEGLAVATEGPVRIIQPPPGHVAGSGDLLTVSWTSPVNDFSGLQQLYRVDVWRIGQGSVFHTSQYSCSTAAPGEFVCQVHNVPVPADEGRYTVSVRVIPAQAGEDELASLNGGYPYTGLVLCNQTFQQATRVCDITDVTVDATAPDVALLTIPGAPEATGWFRARPTVTFQCDDRAEGSGCVAGDGDVANGEVVYRTDVPKIVYQGAFQITKEGDTSIEYWGVDRAGNSGEGAPLANPSAGSGQHGRADLQIDTVPPAGTFQFLSSPSGSNGWFTSAPDVRLTCSDTTSGCTGGTIDDPLGPGAAGATPLTLTVAGDGSRSLTGTIRDAAGHATSLGPLALKLDTAAPGTTLATTPPNPDGVAGWFRSAVTVQLSCADATSGCDRIQYRLNGGPWVQYSGAIVLAAAGTTTLDFFATDEAGLAETVQTSQFSIDAVPPGLTVTPDRPVDGANGWYLGPVEVSLSCSDDTSGPAGATLTIVGSTSTTISGACSPTEPLSGSIDTEGVHSVDASGNDIAGNTRIVPPDSISTDLAAPTGSVCRLSGGSCASDGTITAVDVPVQASCGDGAGSGVSTLRVWASSALGSTTPVAYSDGLSLDIRPVATNPFPGLYFEENVVVHASCRDVAGRESTFESAAFTVDTTGPLRYDVVLQNSPDRTVPNASPIALTYVVNQWGAGHFGEPLPVAGVQLLDSCDAAFSIAGTTDLAGLVTFAVSESGARRCLNLGGLDEPEGGVTYPGDVNVIWTGFGIQRDQSLDTPRTTLYANPGETYRVGFRITTTWNNQPLGGARVELASGALSFSGLTGADGVVRVPTSRADPTEVVFGSTLSFDPSDGPAQVASGPSVTLRWARVEYANLSPPADGWHNVDDLVAFGFDAILNYGAGTEPAEGAEVQAQIGSAAGSPALVVATDSSGRGTFELQRAHVSDERISLVGVSTPEGVTAQVGADFGRHRWTEIELEAGPDDSFVNVGDTITFALGATWAHDENEDGILNDAVGSATIDATAGAVTLATCAVADGAGSCPLVQAAPFNGAITFVATASDQGVLRQAGGTNLQADAVWTRIAFSGCAVDDAFVDAGAAVTLTCDANFELVGPVEASTLETVDPLPPGCSLDQGTIAAGVATAVVHCSAPSNLAAGAALMVTSASEDVSSFTGAPTLAARWAKIEFSSLATDPAGGGWHNVGTTVSFLGAAEYVFGATAADRLPADEAVVALATTGPGILGTADAAGAFSIPLGFATVMDATPDLSVVSTPESVTLFDAADYGRQRWTEIALALTPDDTVVNVGQDVDVSVVALYAHDEDVDGELNDAVGTADLSVHVNPPIATCAVVAGAATCRVNRTEVHDSPLTFVVDESEHAITRQAGGTDATATIVWTQVEFTACGVDDGFVNVGDTVRLTCAAAYAHTGHPPIVQGTVAAEGSTLPAGCSALPGTIVDGALAAEVRCTEVADANPGGISFVVTSTDEGVTQMTTSAVMEAVWTRILVTYTASAATGALLDHNAPVTVDVTMSFEHGGSDVPAGTFLSFLAEETGGAAFNCVEAFDPATASATCPLELSMDSGEFTFVASAASYQDSDGDGILEADIADFAVAAGPVLAFRWTSIGFGDFQCSVGSATPGACASSYPVNTLVEVHVTAVEADTGAPLVEGLAFPLRFTIAGQEYVDMNPAAREFVRFTAGCVTVTARGLEATFGATQVTWDTPRSQQICWA